jgi:hypothetical protein
MAKNQVVRVRPEVLAADQEVYIVVQALGDYKPANAVYAKTALTPCYTAMQSAREIDIKAEQARAAAHDNLVAAEWDFHNRMLGVKAQVVAQYGPDSNEVQSLGVKKKSERKAPGRRKEAKST